VLIYLGFVQLSVAATSPYDWMSSYYRTHDISGFDQFWSRTVEQGALHKSARLRGFVTGFAGALFRQHPELINSYIKSVGMFPEADRDSVKIILWLADSENARCLLKSAAAEAHLVSRRPPSIENRAIYSEEDIDFCTGWFEASGDTGALIPVTNVLLKPENYSGDLRIETAFVNLKGLYERDPEMLSIIQNLLIGDQLDERSRKNGLLALKALREQKP